jgi:hypothetical protein
MSRQVVWRVPPLKSFRSINCQMTFLLLTPSWCFVSVDLRAIWLTLSTHLCVCAISDYNLGSWLSVVIASVLQLCWRFEITFRWVVCVPSVEKTLSVQFCKERWAVHWTRLSLLEVSVLRVLMSSYWGGRGFDCPSAKLVARLMLLNESSHRLVGSTPTYSQFYHPFCELVQ